MPEQINRNSFPVDIGVIGAGSWGTALSLLLARAGHSIDLWVYEKELCRLIEETRENKFFLPGYELSEKIKPTLSLEKALAGKSVLVLVVPTHVLRQTLLKVRDHLQPDCLIINASKGIENETLVTAHQILKELIKVPYTPAVLSGPTFAAEIAREAPSCAVAAAADQESADLVKDLFSTSKFRVFTSADIIGVELGGALKNVIAIATGIADGLELGSNARAALITRGLVEITRIGTALGARPETFSGLSGMGDLVLTCTGDLSRNRNVGIKLGKGEKLKDITAKMNMVAEGVRTVKSAFALKQKYNIQASIIEETYRVIYEEKSPQQALKDLMKIEVSAEFTGVKGL